jgi:hypothetical protein
MLTLRHEQVAALERALARTREDRAVRHVRREHPVVSAGMSDELVREAVLIATRQCALYGFEGEELVHAYLDLMMLLGFDFHRDPRQAWVLPTLTDPHMGARTRLVLLVEDARARTHQRPRDASR